METEIVVQGRAFVRVLPDRAVLRALVDGDGQSRDEAYRQAEPLATRVDEVVERRRAAFGRVTTAALSVHPKTRWKRGESVRTGWRASRASLLEVTDFTVLGDLFAELTSAGAAVDGPSWALDPDNPAHAEARRLAAADARVRADAYAGALGLRVTAVAWVAEPGLRLPGRHNGGGDYDMQMATMAAPAGMARGGPIEEVIDVTPDEVAVTANVEVGFTFDAAEPGPT
jgi:uncharacterized protein YggE